MSIMIINVLKLDFGKGTSLQEKASGSGNKSGDVTSGMSCNFNG